MPLPEPEPAANSSETALPPFASWDDVWQEETVAVGRDRLSVPEFLRRAAIHLEHAGTLSQDEFARLLDAFLGGGLPALRAATRDVAWVQYDVLLPSPDRAGLYCALADAGREVLATGIADEFFFVHKPPGLRVRFQTVAAGRTELDAVVRGRLKGWHSGGLVTGWHPAVYEPESHLFGGPVSMRSVHRIFTADSLAWLGFHAAAQPVGPAWAMSLLMVRALLDALGVVGWEDLNVWERLRTHAGRRLTPDARASTGPVADAIRRSWAAPKRLWSLLNYSARTLVSDYRRVVTDECQRWLTDYFTSPGAYVGPREAAAFVIVFHWNRAGLPATRQAVITEALAAREPSQLDR